MAVLTYIPNNASARDWRDTVNALIKRVDALDAAGIPVATPAPAFTTQPSISPTSGTAGSTVYAATPGTVSNGSVVSRAWLLNGVAISNGVTAVPASSGTLTYQETASGPGGTTTSTVQVAAVTAAATAPTPAPSFTSQPSISPNSGTAGATTFAATGGNVSNGSITSRSWTINGTVISTGLTASPASSGTLTYQEAATGPGGTAQSTVQQVTVASAAAAAPAFTSQPTVSPSTGTAGTTTYTATPGAVSNGLITSRAWALNGSTISTGLTTAPASAGTLTYQEFASGNGGTAQSTVASVTVSAAANGTDFTMTQLAAPNRIYQRQTVTGGGQGKGVGTIPVPVNVSALGTPRFRIRASDGTILQANTALPAFTATGTQTLQVTGVDARLGWFYVDLSVDGTTWQNGTVLVGMGSLTAVSGQSLATRMFTARDSQATVTIASTGVSIPANTSCFAQALEPTATAAALPSWGLIAEGTGPYNSAFAAEYLGNRIAATGVNCALVGYARGSQSITRFVPGGADSAGLRAALDAVGGFETFIWMQGHTDSLAGMSSATYQGHLSSLFTDMTARNAIRGSNYNKLLGTIPNITSTAWGTPAQILTIRSAASAWAAANGGVRINAQDIELYDGVHQSQAGSARLADHFYRASRPGIGLPGDDSGPSLASGARAAGAVDIVLPVTYPTGATALVSVGTPANRFSVFNSGSMTSPLALDSTTPITIGSSSITLRLAAAPADTQALDVYAFAPIDAANGQSNAVYDNHTDGDGITRGRQLMATLSPVVVAAPGGGGGTPIKVGPDLTVTGTPVYQAGRTNFGQERTAAGYGRAASGTGIDVLIATQTWTMECVIALDTGPTAVKVVGGISKRGWIGVAAGGKLVANYQSTASTNGDVYMNGTSPTGDGTNPIITDGARHHVALVVTPSGGSLYVDGILIGTSATAPSTTVGNSVFNLGAYQNNASFVFPGSIDEFAVWTVAKYTAAFTPRTSPLVGNEAGLSALYHLDGDMNAATYIA
ncbi:LamG-like jellyroll fold domain-containing protein [Sphingomonas sp. STIS6.2]|uniref:LamG-like jellyroll fold domain-containing protein n=1 Tax=Sphingomonas sp. STIS6.2 TaxID=1379700 RepID=UPI0004DB50D0|nr:LamG-like jellyroll fold domain-containing protein [Sphingomonas sp. STIS6.2]